MLVKITLLEQEVDQMLVSQQPYLIRTTKPNYKYEDLLHTDKVIWLESKGVEIKHIQTEDFEKYSLREIVYTVIDEKLATEYYLKF